MAPIYYSVLDNNGLFKRSVHNLANRYGYEARSIALDDLNTILVKYDAEFKFKSMLEQFLIFYTEAGYTQYIMSFEVVE